MGLPSIFVSVLLPLATIKPGGTRMNTIQSAVKAQASADAAPEPAPRMQRPDRLVVVVPDVAEVGLLAARIHQVAAVGQRVVVLIGVSSTAVPEAELRRKLALLAAFVRDAGSNTEVRIENDLNWIPDFRLRLQAGDVLACAVDGSVPGGNSRWIDLLATRFQRDVCVFTDGRDWMSSRRSRRIAPWLCSMALIAAFTYLQISLAPRLDHQVMTVWLIASVLAEAVAIAWCNAVLD
jgi:hypothetical protein